jgi:hypothetical protein
MKKLIAALFVLASAMAFAQDQDTSKPLKVTCYEGKAQVTVTYANQVYVSALKPSEQPHSANGDTAGVLFADNQELHGLCTVTPN